MYRAKARGGGGLVVFQPEMHAAAVSHLELENHLRRAFDRDELELFYQPIEQLAGRRRAAPTSPDRAASASSRRSCAGTILSWELLSPSAFLAVAEETGLILALDEWALRQACRDAAALRRSRSGRGFTVSVNVSSRHLYQENLPRLVATVLDETGLPGSRLRLEITESTFLQQASTVDRALEEIKQLGVAVDLDDFGVGLLLAEPSRPPAARPA